MLRQAQQQEGLYRNLRVWQKGIIANAIQANPISLTLFPLTLNNK